VNQNARPNSAVTSSEEPSTFQVRVKDLSTGKEASISDAERFQFHPQISHDGTLLAYTTRSGIQIFRIDDWPPRTIAGMQNGGKASDWSADNKRLLIQTYPQAKIYVYDAASRRESLFLSKPGYELFQAKFSPDNRAVALIGCDSQRPGIDCRIFVVPLKSDGAPDADNWITIDHPSRWDDKPRWSPDGSLIYFVSDRDGQFCLWAQRLDTRTQRPVGTPFPAYHFHNSRLAMNNVGTGELEIDVARDKIVMGLGELTGNIWSLKR
jgi:Tol biopolymer transport system component